METNRVGTLQVLAGPEANKTERLLLEVAQWQPLKEKGKCRIIGFHRQDEQTDKLKSGKEAIDYQVDEARYYQGPLEIKSYIERHNDEFEGFYVVAVDDCQFEEDDPELLAYTLDEIVNEGHQVIAAGVDQNYKGRPYESTSHLMAVADKSKKVSSRCSICGKRATKSVFVGGDEEESLYDQFEARCEDHWHESERTMGKLEVIAGPMFSGKTYRLLERVDKLQLESQELQVFKPAGDDRWDKEEIRSRGVLKTPVSRDAQPLKSAEGILEYTSSQTRYILIDEAHFFDESLVEVIRKTLKRGVNVVVSGLDLDYQGGVFLPVARLMAIASKVRKITAVCGREDCESPATRTARRKEVKSNKRILPGDEEYIPLCRKHHRDHLNSGLPRDTS